VKEDFFLSVEIEGKKDIILIQNFRTQNTELRILELRTQNSEAKKRKLRNKEAKKNDKKIHHPRTPPTSRGQAPHRILFNRGSPIRSRTGFTDLMDYINHPRMREGRLRNEFAPRSDEEPRRFNFIYFKNEFSRMIF